MFLESKVRVGRSRLTLCYCGKGRVLKRRWYINLGRLDYLSAAEFCEKRAWGEDVKRKLEREDFSGSWETALHLRSGNTG